MNKNQIKNNIQKSYNYVRYYFMRLPKITRYMVIALMGLFLLGQFVDLSFFVLKKIGLGFNPVQMFTYAFLQYDFMQLLFNVLAIWIFGYQIEEYWGTKRFSIFVVVTILATAIAHLLLGSLFTVGISGLVFALLLAYGMMWPERKIYLLLPPIPVKAKYLVMIYAGIMFLSILSSGGSFSSRLAYLAGPLSAYLLIQYWRGKPPFNSNKKNSKAKIYRYK